MEIGDIVVRKSYGKDITFKIVEIKYQGNKAIYTLKGINIRILADSSEDDLEVIPENYQFRNEEVFTRKVNDSIKKVLLSRKDIIKVNEIKNMRSEKKNSNNEMSFGRPGKILHIDGDPDYLETCLKVYRRFGLESVGRMILERDQPDYVVDLVKEYKPDMVVITGHDAINKSARDYMDINNYRNSKYFVEAVCQLRNYNSNYDDLVIFAGACQSCYEAILDAGANFASSPNRILIHCLDPVFLCEKVAYTSIDKIVGIQDAVENTITGVKGIGGLQTRGKYRAGFPKSIYI